MDPGISDPESRRSLVCLTMFQIENGPHMGKADNGLSGPMPGNGTACPRSRQTSLKGEFTSVHTTPLPRTPAVWRKSTEPHGMASVRYTLSSPKCVLKWKPAGLRGCEDFAKMPYYNSHISYKKQTSHIKAVWNNRHVCGASLSQTGGTAPRAAKTMITAHHPAHETKTKQHQPSPEESDN